ncbi:MAG: EAL domain-containing protein [Thermoleophilia bacterium]|nr:EAL domain-containing protein [Thermoleophilia bacterium]
MVLYSQPIVPLAGGEPSEELLLRMLGPGGEVILPGSFLPVAERYGLIGEIDRWVIGEADRRRLRPRPGDERGQSAPGPGDRRPRQGLRLPNDRRGRRGRRGTGDPHKNYGVDFAQGIYLGAPNPP